MLKSINSLLPFAFLFSLASAQGHNGSAIVAQPIEGITVDGDLEDWPDTLPIYYLTHNDFGAKPKDKEDLKVAARAGYHEKKKVLYLAIEVTDESIVLDPNAGKAWDTQDGCSLYIDLAHAKGVSTPVQYFQSGDELRIHGIKANQVAVTCQVRRQDSSITYEWSVPLDQAFIPGRSFGFDIDVTDKDEDGSFTWIALTPGTRKAYYASNMGDLFLLESGAKLGSVSGQLIWSKTTTQEKKPSLVAIQSEANPAFRVELKCDEAGYFEAELPVGRYEVRPVDTLEARVFENEHLHFQIKEDVKIEISPLAAVPLPKPNLIGKKGVLHQDKFDADSVDRFVRTYMDFHKIPGISLAIVKESKLAYLKHYGVENAATKKALEPDSVFEACSLTKPVFGFAVNRLVERGLLGLDTPLNEYLPNAEGYTDLCTDKKRYQKITARHVLAHRTGFPNWRSDKEIPINFEPGTGYGYSGEGFELLGAVVAHLTKKDLVQVVTEETFTPMGMENVHLIWNETLAKRVGNGHTNGKHPIQKSRSRSPGMAYSLHTNAKNYAKMITGILDRKGLSKSTYDEMLKTQYKITDPDNPHEYPYGLGLVSEDTEFGKKYWHSGSNPGWKCQFAVYDQLKMGYAVFTNSNEGWVFIKDFEQFLITGKKDEVH